MKTVLKNKKLRYHDKQRKTWQNEIVCIYLHNVSQFNPYGREYEEMKNQRTEKVAFGQMNGLKVEQQWHDHLD